MSSALSVSSSLSDTFDGSALVSVAEVASIPDIFVSPDFDMLAGSVDGKMANILLLSIM